MFQQKNQLSIELGYFCRALSNRLIEIYNVVHFKNSKIDDFVDFRPDLGQKSTILASAERQVDPAKSKNFRTSNNASIFLWAPFFRIFSALQSGKKTFFEIPLLICRCAKMTVPPPTKFCYQIMADAPMGFQRVSKTVPVLCVAFGAFRQK